MKRFFISTAFIFFGTIIGFRAALIASYFITKDSNDDLIQFEALLKHSDVKIVEAHFICDGNTSNDVASVVGSIFDMNINNVRNRITFRCADNVCVLGFSNCKPWHNDSCGGRSLSFELDKNKKIIPSTFRCIDAP